MPVTARGGCANTESAPKVNPGRQIHCGRGTGRMPVLCWLFGSDFLPNEPSYL